MAKAETIIKTQKRVNKETGKKEVEKIEYRIDASFIPEKVSDICMEFIINYCRNIDCQFEVDENNNILVTKGQAATYPCVVAHTDEVHEERPEGFRVVVDPDDNDIISGLDACGECCGIGADDKNGIWVALKMLEELPVLKCAFFTGEEIGCEGSRNVDISFFDDCRYVVQCDRKNGNDFIINVSGLELNTQRFREDCELDRFGYRPKYGYSTDVAALKERGLKISVVNLSCGYYNPHEPAEYTRFSELQNALNFARHICSLTETY